MSIAQYSDILIPLTNPAAPPHPHPHVFGAYTSSEPHWDMQALAHIIGYTSVP